MKKTGLLHAELSRTIASMGHGDILVIGDAGPAGAAGRAGDRPGAAREGVPGFLETLEIVLTELHVERAVIDEEMATVSPAMSAAFHAAWPSEIALHSVPHAELQATAKGAKALVRTGECTPYSNIVLVAGVVF
jgi:D-ribose pyranase